MSVTGYAIHVPEH